jgi:putative toxin-antitoxin system antitoxin component (TIGR02293 family)
MKKVKQYPIIDNESLESTLQEPAFAYAAAPLKVYNHDDKLSYHNFAKIGVTYELYCKLIDMTGFNLESLAELLHVNSRTLRRLDDTKHLSLDLSEKVLELTRLYQIGLDVFGDLSILQSWIDSPLTALGDKTPRSFLDTSFGIEVVRDVLGRIEHGVYS